MSAATDTGAAVLEERPVNTFQAEESLEQKEAVYFEKAHDLIQRYYATLTSNYCEVRRGYEDKVGLLTYPNSGTSWTLQLVRIASGIRIHTEYEGELKNSGGDPSRGVFAINNPNERMPEYHEPVLVKSHVSHYSYYDAATIRPGEFDLACQTWARNLSTSYARHVRLVRNPFDNIRARFHLYERNHRGNEGIADLSFSEFARQDLRRYLVWHACCNRIAQSKPLLTVLYGNELTNCRFELSRILNFCGFDTTFQDVERAVTQAPPKYVEENRVPSHLKHYTIDDIHWLANELESWMGSNPS